MKVSFYVDLVPTFSRYEPKRVNAIKAANLRQNIRGSARRANMAVKLTIEVDERAFEPAPTPEVTINLNVSPGSFVPPTVVEGEIVEPPTVYDGPRLLTMDRTKE